MGGEVVLEMARSGEDLALAVSFHGLLATPLPAKRNKVKARLLVCHGRADPLVPPKQVRTFLEEMDVAGSIVICISIPAWFTVLLIRRATRKRWTR